MNNESPEPELLETIFDNTNVGAGSIHANEKRAILQAENEIAKQYWGRFQPRIVLTFLFFTIAWSAVIYLGLTGSMSLWVGVVCNTALATTFYMPMHEAVHKNIWGLETRARWGEDLVGVLCSIPLLMNFKSHRSGHMRHHAFTNDVQRDPDHFSDGRLIELPKKIYAIILVNTFLPFFAIIPTTRRVLPKSMQTVFEGRGASRKEGLAQVRFWLITHVALAASFVLGFGWEALALWYIPARLQQGWLVFIFAWYPHHPASETSRYRHTRVAVFRGSGFFIRGHDHHAMHHLFPRVPHYRLRQVWSEQAVEMVAKGVRAEGRAVAATSPISW